MCEKKQLEDFETYKGCRTNENENLTQRLKGKIFHNGGTLNFESSKNKIQMRINKKKRKLELKENK